MDPDAAGLHTLLDREKIRDCIASVARGEDRRNADLISASYWPDATCDYGIFTGSFPDYLDWVLPGSPAIVMTQHILGQILITLNGDAARSETHVIAYHRVDVGADRDRAINPAPVYSSCRRSCNQHLDTHGYFIGKHE